MYLSFRKAIAALAFASLIGSVPAGVVAQSAVLTYPAAGQSADQVKKDEFECHRWSMERTGFDPRRPPPQIRTDAYASAPSSGGRGFGSGSVGQGGMVGDGARGAALGAVGGAIAGNAGKGAAIGAATGALFGGMRRNSRKQQEQDWQRQQQAQLQQEQAQLNQQYAQGQQAFNNAYALCMESRDYNVN
jgi:YMGG-like Gly-zipper